jgi:hypothetical protein
MQHVDDINDPVLRGLAREVELVERLAGLVATVIREAYQAGLSDALPPPPAQPLFGGSDAVAEARGMERAAQWHDQQAKTFTLTHPQKAEAHRGYAQAIRKLADELKEPL